MTELIYACAGIADGRISGAHAAAPEWHGTGLVQINQPQCGSYAKNQGLIKMQHGGARSGAGRKPRTLFCQDVDFGPRWYAVVTHSQAEMWALQNLVRQGYDAYLPMIEEERRDTVTPTMQRIVSTVMWPGYVFVLTDIRRDNWRPIAHTNGVRSILGTHPERPAPLPVGLLEAIQASADDRRIVRSAPPAIAEGSPLSIVAGPFADHRGVCLWSDATRVGIALSLFGGDRHVTVRRSAVQQIAAE